MNFEEALKSRDLEMIMNKAASKFMSQLDVDELHTCKLNALWKASEGHEEGRSKFTTYLFNGVRQQCISAIKFNNRHRNKTRPLHDNISEARLQQRNSAKKDKKLSKLTKRTTEVVYNNTRRIGSCRIWNLCFF